MKMTTIWNVRKQSYMLITGREKIWNRKPCRLSDDIWRRWIQDSTEEIEYPYKDWSRDVDIQRGRARGVHKFMLLNEHILFKISSLTPSCTVSSSPFSLSPNRLYQEYLTDNTAKTNWKIKITLLACSLYVTKNI